MKVILFLGDASNQIALANKICLYSNVVGLVSVNKKILVKKPLSSLFDRVLTRLFISEITSSWNTMLNYYKKQYTNWPNIPNIEVDDINNTRVSDFVNTLKPDLIVVSGTNLLKKDLLNTLNPSIGIINLHTGLSPYVKGGPNCTNWCISKGNYHLIGNTVMWIDSGIDSGNIISSELTEFLNPKSFNDLHIQVMEHAHSLLLRCIKVIENELDGVNSIRQSEICSGKLYLSKDWTFPEKLRLKKNYNWFLKNYNDTQIDMKKKNTITISI